MSLGFRGFRAKGYRVSKFYIGVEGCRVWRVQGLRVTRFREMVV